MEEQRDARARGAARRHGPSDDARAACVDFARGAGFPTRFVGYETTEVRHDASARSSATNGRAAGQARREPVLRRGRRPGRPTPAGRDARRAPARVSDVYRLGDDQARRARASSEGELDAGRAGDALRRPRRAPRDRCATTPPPTCCTRRCASELGTHVRQAGSSVRPRQAALRLHARRARCRAEELRESRTRSTAGSPRTTACARSHDHARRGRGSSARWRCSARSTATRCAWSRSRTASRASCAAARTSRSTAEIGLFKMTSRELERGERAPHRGGHRARRRATLLRAPRPRSCASIADAAAHAARGRARRAVADARRSAQGAASASAAAAAPASSTSWRDALAARPPSIGGVKVVDARSSTCRRPEGAARALRPRQAALGDAAVVLGAARDGPRAPGRELRARGRRARPEGRRDRQGGGRRSPAAAAAAATRWRRPAARDPEKLPEALAAARAGDRDALLGLSRSWRSTTASARCGVRGQRPDRRRSRRRSTWSSARHRDAGSPRSPRLVREREAERVVVGLPLTLAGDEGAAGRGGARVRGAARPSA